MNDTPEEIMQKQHDIFLAKPAEERFRLTFDIIEAGIALTRASIRNSNNDFSEKEIKKEVFRQLYAGSFSEEELNKILDSF